MKQTHINYRADAYICFVFFFQMAFECVVKTNKWQIGVLPCYCVLDLKEKYWPIWISTVSAQLCYLWGQCERVYGFCLFIQFCHLFIACLAHVFVVHVFVLSVTLLVPSFCHVIVCICVHVCVQMRSCQALDAYVDVLMEVLLSINLASRSCTMAN